MDYQAPTDGRPYETGLTAEVMYKTIESLLDNKIGQEELSKHRGKDISTDAVARNLWKDYPSIRPELEEFVRSYFFSNFEGFPGFGELFDVVDWKGNNKRLHGYIDGLGDGGYEVVSLLFEEVTRLKDRTFEERKKLDTYNGLELERANAVEAFGQLVTSLYGFMELAIESVSKKHQS